MKYNEKEMIYSSYKQENELHKPQQKNSYS